MGAPELTTYVHPQDGSTVSFERNGELKASIRVSGVEKLEDIDWDQNDGVIENEQIAFSNAISFTGQGGSEKDSLQSLEDIIASQLSNNTNINHTLEDWGFKKTQQEEIIVNAVHNALREETNRCIRLNLPPEEYAIAA